MVRILPGCSSARRCRGRASRTTAFGRRFPRRQRIEGIRQPDESEVYREVQAHEPWRLDRDWRAPDGAYHIEEGREERMIRRHACFGGRVAVPHNVAVDPRPTHRVPRRHCSRFPWQQGRLSLRISTLGSCSRTSSRARSRTRSNRANRGSIARATSSMSVPGRFTASSETCARQPQRRSSSSRTPALCHLG
jgi:hypothetical protein